MVELLALFKYPTVTNLGPKEGYENCISIGVSPSFANYMVETLITKSLDKGYGEGVLSYEEAVANVNLYTDKARVALEYIAKETKATYSQ
ncbi:hypothetical protein J1614_006774 [Plenodomus biglobosus]|nr:hypothetical protein J1614_006774 [Plenodomus biglobosus]